MRLALRAGMPFSCLLMAQRQALLCKPPCHTSLDGFVASCHPIRPTSRPLMMKKHGLHRLLSLKTGRRGTRLCQSLGADVALNGSRVGENAAQIREVGQLHQDFLPDAVIVLGGGQSGAKQLPVWVERRLDAAIEEHGRPPYPPIVVLGGGTPHRAPYTNDWGFVVHEATSCAEYLLQRGVEPHRVFKEWGSYDTIANAYFALVWHAAPAGWKNLLVITSSFHMERSELIFRWVFGLRGVERMAGADRGFQLAFRAVTDDGIDPVVISARRMREKQQVEDLKLKMAEITTLAQFHRWFHSSHKAYNVEHQDQFGAASASDIPNIALDSY